MLAWWTAFRSANHANFVDWVMHDWIMQILLTGSCLDLASLSRGRIFGSLYHELPAEAPCLWQEGGVKRK